MRTLNRGDEPECDSSNHGHERGKDEHSSVDHDRFHLRNGNGNECFVARLISALMFLHGAMLAQGAALNGSFATVPAASVVNLTTQGRIDWVHWGLYTETSLDRKAGVAPQISDFALLDATNGFAFAYQFGDNANGYSWNDGTPTPAVTNTTTGVWSYGTPLIGSGFKITAPADTATRTVKVYVGAFKARGQLEAHLSDGSAKRPRANRTQGGAVHLCDDDQHYAFRD